MAISQTFRAACGKGELRRRRQRLKVIWLARRTLIAAERRIVAETGDIYIRMHAVDEDELIMPHRFFVERPNVAQLRAYYASRVQAKADDTLSEPEAGK